MQEIEVTQTEIDNIRKFADTEGQVSWYYKYSNEFNIFSERLDLFFSFPQTNFLFGIFLESSVGLLDKYASAKHQIILILTNITKREFPLRIIGIILEKKVVAKQCDAAWNNLNPSPNFQSCFRSANMTSQPTAATRKCLPVWTKTKTRSCLI